MYDYSLLLEITKISSRRSQREGIWHKLISFMDGEINLTIMEHKSQRGNEYSLHRKPFCVGRGNMGRGYFPHRKRCYERVTASTPCLAL